MLEISIRHILCDIESGFFFRFLLNFRKFADDFKEPSKALGFQFSFKYGNTFPLLKKVYSYL